MAEIAFTEPPQAETIEKIPRGNQSGAMVGSLWRSSTAGTPPGNAGRDGLDGYGRSGSDRKN